MKDKEPFRLKQASNPRTESLWASLLAGSTNWSKVKPHPHRPCNIHQTVKEHLLWPSYKQWTQSAGVHQNRNDAVQLQHGWSMFTHWEKLSSQTAELLSVHICLAKSEFHKTEAIWHVLLNCTVQLKLKCTTCMSINDKTSQICNRAHFIHNI